MISAVMIVVMQSLSALAASDITVSLNAEKITSSSKTVTVTCDMAGQGSVTNGKLRIKYDPKALVLEKSSAGNGLSGAMTQINDPITGNKAEGEIVVAFASAQALKTEGTMIELQFKIADGFPKESGSEVTVAVEEFGLDGKTVEANAKNCIVTMTDVVDPSSSSDGSSSDGSSSDGSSSDGSSSDSSSSDGSSSDGSSSDSSDQTKPDKTTVPETSTDDSRGDTPSTGDAANVVLPIVVIVIAIIVIIIVVQGRNKKK